MWFFKALKHKNFVQGGCTGHGYHSYVESVRDIGAFSLPSDVYTKVVADLPNNNKLNHTQMTLSDVIFRIWSF